MSRHAPSAFRLPLVESGKWFPPSHHSRGEYPIGILFADLLGLPAVDDPHRLRLQDGVPLDLVAGIELNLLLGRKLLDVHLVASAGHE